MAVTVPNLAAVANPTVSYARLHGTLEGYLVRTEAGAMVFVDHDAHLYALTPDQAQALTLLGAVPAVERAHVLAALERCEEV
jgi:hypothetical protein